MNESTYQLGRFLRVADEIHRLYCEIVRNKSLPPELCGSSLLTSMLESPARTFHQLAMHPLHTSNGQRRSIAMKSWARPLLDATWSQIADALTKSNGRPSYAEERAKFFRLSFVFSKI